MSEILRQSQGKNGVLSLQLYRPKAFNSLSLALLEALKAALLAAADNPAVRVIRIDGGDGAFCAGHDLKEIGADRTYAPVKRLFETCSATMLQIARQPQPVIACVDGVETAAGCQLVAACDLAVCTERSRFATSGVKFGLFCSTPMVALSRNIPRKAAMEMLLTGDFISSARAWELGLVNQVASNGQLDPAVDALAARLLDKPADVLALGKRAFYEQLELGMSEAYAMTTEVIVGNAIGETFGEGLDAFVNKRKPAWVKA